MIIKGILGRSLGGFICIRGFAPLIDLAKISKSTTYQRDLDQPHQKELQDYLERREFLFFPEIILSYTLSAQYDNMVLSSSPAELLNQRDNTVGKQKIHFSPVNHAYKVRGNPIKQDFYTVTLEINDQTVLEKLFSRIDGNHRLSAAENLTSQQADEPTPFCLILLNENDPNNEKTQSIIFHNINTKAKPLTFEENLKVIIEGGYYNDLNQFVHHFSSHELEQHFGWEYVLVRQLKGQIDESYLSYILPIFQTQEKTVLLQLIQFLKHQNSIATLEDDTVNRIKAALSLINEHYRNHVYLANCHEKGLLFALLYYALQKQSQLNAFVAWVKRNHLDQIKVIDATSMVDIFDKVHASQIKIFMAMPYYSDQGVDSYNTALLNAVNAITAQNPHINLMHHPIMRTCSPTHDVIADILNKIQHCDIFIADITDNNANVLYEYGVARGYQKPCILLRKRTADQAVKSDYANDLRFEFEGDFDLQTNLQKQIEGVLIDLGLEVR